MLAPVKTTRDNQRHLPLSNRRISKLAIVLLVALPSLACVETGPSTQAQVCESYEELAEELASTRLWDNGVFRRAGSLGRVASRYEQSAGVMADGERLEEISDSDQTSGQALDNATRSISPLCGQSSLSGYTARLALGLG